MKNKFKFGDGLEILVFLQEKLCSKVAYTGQEFAHLRTKKTVPDGDIIGFIEVAHRKYKDFFSNPDLCLLYELPTINRSLKYALYCKRLVQSMLAEKFGGNCVGHYWLMRNENETVYGYKGDKLPEASEIIKFVESIL